MRGMILALLVILVAATVFAASNPEIVTVRFWQWPLFSGSLSLVVVGAGLLGALLTHLTSFARHARLARRVRELEKRLGVEETQKAPPGLPGSGARIEYLDKENLR